MPYWGETVDISDIRHDGDMSFEKKRDEIIQRLRGSKWISCTDWYWEIKEALDNLSKAKDIEEFDHLFNTIYDFADIDRVWIETN